MGNNDNFFLKKLFFEDLFKAVKNNKTVVAYSVVEGMKMAIASEISESVLYIAANYESCRNTHKALLEYGKNAVMLTEVGDTMLHRVAQAKESMLKRVKALYGILKGATHIVTTIEALSQLFPSKSGFLQGIINIKIGEEYDVFELKSKLIQLGYTENTIENAGDFRYRAGNLEVFSPNYDNPVKISFFGDEVEAIRFFDTESALTTNSEEQITLLPVTDIIALNYESSYLERRIRARYPRVCTAAVQARLDEITSEVLLNSLATVNNPANVWLLPFLRDYMSTLFDYLKDNTIILMEEPKIIFDNLNNSYSKHVRRVELLCKQGEALECHKRSILTPEEVIDRLDKYHRVGFSTLQSDVNANLFAEDNVFDLRSQSIPNYFMDISLLIKDVEFYAAEGYRILVYANFQVAERLLELFNTNNINASIGSVTDLARGKVIICESDISHGYLWQAGKLLVIGRQDIRPQLVKSGDEPTKKTIKINPKEGDYVVHKDYGIARFLGIERIKSIVSGERDYMVLQYQGTEKLYLPMHCLDMLSYYAGQDETPKLSKLSGNEFEKVKEQVKQSVREMAFDLLELYKKREKAKGYVYSRDTLAQMNFEMRFAFEPTADQLRATEEIKRDMEQGKVMDRLLCGDVGFGKTEVAIRAMYKTIVEGKQVAFLAPTTILVEQHLVTLKERFRGEGINIAALTRFRSKDEVAQILEGIKTGKINIVISTHKLLYSKAEFFDLGLLVLDEEQRFGVEHKEIIKTLRQNVNVLSMTATPIPRTLHMALSGIRDVSTLETPPKGRKPVETVVIEYSDNLVVDAIRKEMARAGYTYILFNRIKGIYDFAANIARLIPEARIDVGHGRLDEESMVNTMYKFYNGETDVLIATTIIENGLDVPNANTLIVVDADRLGLSELYQLRGRVGRSSRLAVAYFTYKSDLLTENGLKRLSAMVENSALGSGYKLALRDLEMRGAGNVLGREQHGHIMRVGYDVYCELLDESVQELRGEDVVKKINTEVKIKLDAYLPVSYVSDEISRIKIHRQIAEVKGVDAAKKLLAELEKAFGKPPIELVNLIKVSLLRVLGGGIGVTKVVIDNKDWYLVFVSNEYLKSKAILDAVQQTGDVIISDFGKEPIIRFTAKCSLISKRVDNTIAFLSRCKKG